MLLVDVIKGFVDLDSYVLQQLECAEELLGRGPDFFSIQSHFLAREQATASTTQSTSLLWRFLTQSNPPQERIRTDEGSEFHDGGAVQASDDDEGEFN